MYIKFHIDLKIKKKLSVGLDLASFGKSVVSQWWGDVFTRFVYETCNQQLYY
jgi:hypothetical protein